MFYRYDHMLRHAAMEFIAATIHHRSQYVSCHLELLFAHLLVTSYTASAICGLFASVGNSYLSNSAGG